MQKVGATVHGSDPRSPRKGFLGVLLLGIVSGVALGAGTVMFTAGEQQVVSGTSLDLPVRALQVALDNNDAEVANRALRDLLPRLPLVHELLVEAAEWDDEIGQLARDKIQEDAVSLLRYIDRKSLEEGPRSAEFQETRRMLRTIIKERPPRRPGGGE